LAYYGVIPGGGLADALHIVPDEVTGALGMLWIFSMALFVTWAMGGRLALRRLLRRTFHWRVRPGWWLMILLALPTITVGLALLMGDSLRSVDLRSVLISQLTLLLINFAVTNLWEETAWTGLLQTRLEERHNWFVAVMLTAIPFAAFHLPLQFFLGEPVTPISLAIAFGAYLLLCMFFRPSLAVVRRGTRDSLFLVALQHSVFNRTANENGIAATLLSSDARQPEPVLHARPMQATRLSAQDGERDQELPHHPNDEHPVHKHWMERGVRNDRGRDDPYLQRAPFGTHSRRARVGGAPGRI